MNEQGKLVFDHSKSEAFLTASSTLLLNILDAEDRRDGAFLENTLLELEAAENAPVV